MTVRQMAYHINETRNRPRLFFPVLVLCLAVFALASVFVSSDNARNAQIRAAYLSGTGHSGYAGKHYPTSYYIARAHARKAARDKAAKK